MEIIKTDAIVLRSLKHSESSVIINVFTESQGRISLLAKGARKAKQHVPLDSFSLINTVFRSKSSREIQLLTSAELIDPFLRIRDNLKTIYIAIGMCELVLKTTEPNDPNPLLFKYLAQSLEGMNKTRTNHRNYFYFFIMGMLEAIGFGIDFKSCVKCGRSISGEGNGSLKLHFDSGGIICGNCASGDIKMANIQPEAFKALLYLDTQPLDRIGRLKISDSAGKQMEGLLFAYLRHHIDSFKSLKSQEFMRQ
jgi:DNA repair protein RecO (recombination protein O)